VLRRLEREVEAARQKESPGDRARRAQREARVRIEPRGMTREDAAAYCSLSPATWDRRVGRRPDATPGPRHASVGPQGYRSGLGSTVWHQIDGDHSIRCGSGRVARIKAVLRSGGLAHDEPSKIPACPGRRSRGERPAGRHRPGKRDGAPCQPRLFLARAPVTTLCAATHPCCHGSPCFLPI
jgi:hypothetical protein